MSDLPINEKQLQAQVNAIQRAMQQVMKDGTHYGTVPGCGDKPTLLKPGAEKLSLMFRLIASFDVQREDLPGGHREYTITCTLRSPSGELLGQGVGSCSTMESKYRYRQAERKCPECGVVAIIKGRPEYGGGWICFGKKGGCGAKYKDGDAVIEKQALGRVENPDIADCYNTVLKIAKKRAHVDATLTTTAASDIFTQDIEDLPPEVINAGVAPQQSKSQQKPVAKRKAKVPTLEEQSTLEAIEAGESYQYRVPTDDELQALSDEQRKKLKEACRHYGMIKRGDTMHFAIKVGVLADFYLDGPDDDEAGGEPEASWEKEADEIINRATAMGGVDDELPEGF